MDKLKLAHDWYMRYAGDYNANIAFKVDLAWKYADAMQAEADSRVNKERPDVLKEEWQPDWSQAPNNAGYWEIDAGDQEKAHWICKRHGINIDTYYVAAPTFDYNGDLKYSLRKRP